MRWIPGILLGLALADLKAEPSGHAGPVTSIVFDELDGEILSCSHAGIFQGIGPTLKRILQPEFRVVSMIAGADSVSLSGGIPGERGMIAILDRTTEELSFWKNVSNDLVYALADSREAAYLALADGKVLESRLGQIRPLYSHTAAARSVAVSPNGKHLASGGMDRLVIVSNLKDSSGSEPIAIQDHTDRVDCLVFSPDSTRIASGARDGKVRLHDPATGKLVRTTSGLTGEVSALAWGGNLERLIAGTSEGHIYQLNLADDTSKKIADWGIESPITALAIMPGPDGKILAGTLNRLAAVDPVVVCTARLIGYDEKFPWFENTTRDDGSVIHADGKSPRVLFQITEPPAYANREIAILFKYTSENRPTPPGPSNKGDFYSFEIPADFFHGNHTSITNIHVDRFRKKSGESN